MRPRVWLTVLGFLGFALGLPSAPAVGDEHVRAGAILHVRTFQTIDARSAWPGMRVSAVVDVPIDVAGHIVLPAGTPVRLEVVYVTPSSNVDGPDRITLRVLWIEGRDRVYPATTNDVQFEGSSEGKLRIPADTQVQFQLNSSVRVE